MKKLLERYDREILAVTIVLIVISGILRFLSYKLGTYTLHIALLPFLILQLLYYIEVYLHRAKPRKRERQRFIIFLLLAALVVFDYFSLLQSDFLVLFILCVAYTLTISVASQEE